MFETYVIPGLIILLQTLVLLVALLVFTAFILYADRKIWAAVQSRRGPNVVGPWGLLQSFADLLKFVLKEPIVPVGFEQGHLPARALRVGDAGARRLGGDPACRRLVDRLGQCRHPLCLRHLLARGLRRDHGRLGVELEIPVPRRAALGRADGLLRGLHRLRDRHRAALRRLAQFVRHRDGPDGRHRHAPRPAEHLPRLALARPAADVRDLLHLGACRDQSPALRPCEKPNPSSLPAT